ncbi:hypothetical protein JMJ35_006991 [Cladonia borealis]|uniref:Uncharacterized protein n=1 Tax=Cladonia borealis TaxID=184061 RepID=A0AA39QYZ4_9LECA|nr:hypothetical protein JMJ35_006991 [Cladonia borealis]
MSIVSTFVLFAIWTGIASANNKTIIHGWVPEPDGRGTWSIIWSCLVTIFICTWSVLHLDVPKRHGWWYLRFRKVRWMLLAALVPELILAMAVEDFLQARSLLGHLVTHGGDEWTLVHAEFAVAGGIRVKSPETDKIMPKRIEALRKAVESGQIKEPPISKEELKSRSKSDGVVKLIVLLQITWFGLQALFRAIQHLQVTPLEIMTVAFFVLAVLIYAIWWNQPQDIEYPIIITLQNAGNRIETSKGVNVGTKTDGGRKAWYLNEKRARWFEDSGFYLVLVIAPMFGAIHCLAWNAPFPTSEETLAWRVCAVATTGLPILAVAIVSASFLFETHIAEQDMDNLIGIISAISLFLYASARITLITLAFTSLRALPADAFQSIAWTNYFPNLGA